MLMVVITTRYLLFFSCVFSQSIFLFVSRDVALISRQILMTFFKKKERRFFRFFFSKKKIKRTKAGKFESTFPLTRNILGVAMLRSLPAVSRLSVHRLSHICCPRQKFHSFYTRNFFLKKKLTSLIDRAKSLTKRFNDWPMGTRLDEFHEAG